MIPAATAVVLGCQSVCIVNAKAVQKMEVNARMAARETVGASIRLLKRKLKIKDRREVTAIMTRAIWNDSPGRTSISIIRIWNAKLTAQSNVKVSPLFHPPVPGEVSRNMPMAARNTPAQAFQTGNRRVRMMDRIGTKTTARPVMKPEREAVVYFSPRVCRIIPRNMKAPRTDPRPTCETETGSRLERTSGIIKSVPNPKRSARNRNGLAYFKAIFTRGKLVPHIRQAKSSQKSAFIFLRI